MSYPNRPIAFVLAASNHGSLIVNRHDYRMIDAKQGYGVGFQILNKSCFDPDEIRFATVLLDSRREYFGDGVFAIDGGANIGVHTIEWSRHMHGWGRVLAVQGRTGPSQPPISPLENGSYLRQFRLGTPAGPAAVWRW